jgi:hypothetical protein
MAPIIKNRKDLIIDALMSIEQRSFSDQDGRVLLSRSSDFLELGAELKNCVNAYKNTLINIHAKDEQGKEEYGVIIHNYSDQPSKELSIIIDNDSRGFKVFEKKFSQNTQIYQFKISRR